MREEIKQYIEFNSLELEYVKKFHGLKTFQCSDHLYSQTDIAALWQF